MGNKDNLDDDALNDKLQENNENTKNDINDMTFIFVFFCTTLYVYYIIFRELTCLIMFSLSYVFFCMYFMQFILNKMLRKLSGLNIFLSILFALAISLLGIALIYIALNI